MHWTGPPVLGWLLGQHTAGQADHLQCVSQAWNLDGARPELPPPALHQRTGGET